jgi:hypothetical protein
LIEDGVGLITGLDDIGKWQFLAVPRREFRLSVVQPVASRYTEGATGVPVIV